MICGGCSLSRYCSLGSDRWGVAMTITVAALTGLIVGLMIGVAGTGLALMERPRRWVVCIRLSEELHRRLREEARDHMCSLKAEMISRLQASFGNDRSHPQA